MQVAFSGRIRRSTAPWRAVKNDDKTLCTNGVNTHGDLDTGSDGMWETKTAKHRNLGWSLSTWTDAHRGWLQLYSGSDLEYCTVPSSAYSSSAIINEHIGCSTLFGAPCSCGHLPYRIMHYHPFVIRYRHYLPTNHPRLISTPQVHIRSWVPLSICTCFREITWEYIVFFLKIPLQLFFVQAVSVLKSLRIIHSTKGPIIQTKSVQSRTVVYRNMIMYVYRFYTKISKIFFYCKWVNILDCVLYFKHSAKFNERNACPPWVEGGLCRASHRGPLI